MANQPSDVIRLFPSNFIDETKKSQIFAEIVFQVKGSDLTSRLLKLHINVAS